MSGLAFFTGELPCPNIRVLPNAMQFIVEIGGGASDILRISNVTSPDCDVDIEWALTEEAITLTTAAGRAIPIRAKHKKARPRALTEIYEQKRQGQTPDINAVLQARRQEQADITSPEVDIGTVTSSQDCPWLSANPISGALPPNATQDIEIVIDAAGLSVGTMQCNLVIDSNDLVNPQVVVPVTLTVQPPSFCENGSFETGDFTGWIVQDLNSPFFPLNVDGTGVNIGFFTSEPTDGNFAALTGWDGDGPGTIRLAQDVTIPGGATTIEFDYRAGWSVSGAQDRTFSFTVEPSGGGTPIQTDVLLTATANTFLGDTGPLHGSIDISAFGGEDVRISFDWLVPESFTGPAFFQLDNVSCPDVGGVVARVDCEPDAPEGCPIAPQIVVDMTNTDALLGSFSGMLSWDPALLEFTGASFESDYTGVINDDNSTAGELVFNGVKAEGTEGEFPILSTDFNVVGALEQEGALNLNFTAMAAALTFEDLLPGLETSDCNFIIREPDPLGDLNDDGLVNSTDALICLSFDIGLTLPDEFQQRLDAGFGDVNFDGQTNSTDCLIILTYDAGIDVPFPVGEPFCGNPVTELALLPQQKVQALGSGQITASWLPQTQAKTGQALEIPVSLDLTQLEEKLGSYSAIISWNPAVLKFEGFSGGKTAGFDNPLVNDADATQGKLRFGHANPQGAEGVINLLNIKFSVTGQTGSDPNLDLQFRSAAAARTFRDLLPLIQPAQHKERLFEITEIPKTYALGQNYPNPFNPETTVKYQIPKDGHVEIAIYNVLGQIVRTLLNEEKQTGSYTISWDGRNAQGKVVPSSVYILRMKSGSFVADRKMVFLK